MYPMCLHRAVLHTKNRLFFYVLDARGDLSCSSVFGMCNKTIWFLYIKMIETREEYIIIYIVFINTHFNVWGKYGVPLYVNQVFVNTP